MNWLSHFFGLDNGSGPIYLAWSGAGADLGELAIVGAFVGAYKKHTCHVGRCWRFGIHPVAQTPFRTCRRHHPTVPDRVTAEHIAEAHERAATASANQKEAP